MRALRSLDRLAEIDFDAHFGVRPTGCTSDPKLATRPQLSLGRELLALLAVPSVFHRILTSPRESSRDF